MSVKKLVFYFSALLVLGLVFQSCTSIGVARLPEKGQLFVSRSSEDGFILAGTLEYPYQPLAYIAIDDSQFTPCASTNILEGSYKSLEKVLSGPLVDKAKKQMGADGVIGLRWNVTPGIITYVSVSGLAVKKK